MVAYDFSPIRAILPIFGFLLVWIVMYLVLWKIKVLGENKWALIFVSLLIGVFFIAFSRGEKLLESVTPWFAVIVIMIFFVLVIMMFIGVDMKNYNKGLMVVFLVIMAIVFLVSFYFVYNDILYYYLPGSPDSGLDNVGANFKNWLWSVNTIGTVVLIVLAALAAWILTRTVKK